jgi:hypothetical protein
MVDLSPVFGLDQKTLCVPIADSQYDRGSGRVTAGHMHWSRGGGEGLPIHYFKKTLRADEKFRLKFTPAGWLLSANSGNCRSKSVRRKFAAKCGDVAIECKARPSALTAPAMRPMRLVPISCNYRVLKNNQNAPFDSR